MESRYRVGFGNSAFSKCAGTPNSITTIAMCPIMRHEQVVGLLSVRHLDRV